MNATRQNASVNTSSPAGASTENHTESPAVTQFPRSSTSNTKKKSKWPLMMAIAVALAFTGGASYSIYKKNYSLPKALTSLAGPTDPEQPISATSTTALPIVAPILPVDPPVLYSEFSKLELAVKQMAVSISSIQDSHANLSQQYSELRDEQEKLAKTLVARRPAARPKLKPEPKVEVTPAVQQPSAQVLSIDSWDGRKSVSVSQGGQIKFLNEGDSIGGYVLKKADGSAQQADFVTPDGQTKRVRAIEGSQ